MNFVLRWLRFHHIYWIKYSLNTDFSLLKTYSKDIMKISVVLRSGLFKLLNTFFTLTQSNKFFKIRNFVLAVF